LYLKVIQDDILLKSLEKWKDHDQLDNTNFVGERLFRQTNFSTALAIIAGDQRGLVGSTEIVNARKFPLAQETRGGRRHRGGDIDDDRGIARKYLLAQESRGGRRQRGGDIDDDRGIARKYLLAQESRGGRRHRGGGIDDDRGIARKYLLAQESRGGRLHRGGDRSGDRGRSRPSW
jgi:hypothetical protein